MTIYVNCYIICLLYRGVNFYMINKEFRKLSRRELVDIIYQMKKNEQEMQAEISALKEELEQKRMHLSNAGSIAEAAASMTNIFAVAQNTANLYLNEIASIKADAEKSCAQKLEDTNRQIAKLISDGEKQYEQLNSRYMADYKKWQELKSEIESLKKES